MSDIKARITPQGNLVKGQLNPQKKITVTEYKVDAQNLTLSKLNDIDLSNASDGAVLVYDGNTSFFVATTEIKNKNTEVNGGHF